MAADNEIQKELEEISPVLSRIPRATPYSSPPPGYFDQLPEAVLAEIKQAKVISIAPKRSGTWRLAVAAVLAGAVIMAGWFFLQTSSNASDPAVIASVKAQMQQVSDTEIAAYVDGNDIVAPVEASPVQLAAEDVPLVLAEATDQELQQYIDQEDLSPKLN